MMNSFCASISASFKLLSCQCNTISNLLERRKASFPHGLWSYSAQVLYLVKINKLSLLGLIGRYIYMHHHLHFIYSTHSHVQLKMCSKCCTYLYKVYNHGVSICCKHGDSKQMHICHIKDADIICLCGQTLIKQ